MTPLVGTGLNADAGVPFRHPFDDGRGDGFKLRVVLGEIEPFAQNRVGFEWFPLLAQGVVKLASRGHQQAVPRFFARSNDEPQLPPDVSRFAPEHLAS